MLRKIGKLNVLGTTKPDAIERILGAVENGTSCVFAFCNAHTVNLAYSRPEFSERLNDAILFNDGIGVDIASKLLYGGYFPENLNGTDLAPAVLSALPQGTAIYLIGGRPTIADRARALLSERFGHLKFVGARDGYFASDESDLILDVIRQTEARLVLVGMGQPRQELWATENVGKLDATFLCIGAYLDFAAGSVPRAPDWIRSARMEWAFRLMIEPRRLAGRYLIGNGTFLFHIAMSKLRRKTNIDDH